MAADTGGVDGCVNTQGPRRRFGLPITFTGRSRGGFINADVAEVYEDSVLAWPDSIIAEPTAANTRRSWPEWAGSAVAPLPQS